MLVRPLPRPPETAAPAAEAPAPLLVDVVVLTGDLDLFHAVREGIGERNPVWRARSADEAADLLITGRCGVLLMDTAAVSTRADTLIEQVVEQFPDVVVCVAGRRQDEPLLASLISDGLVYRFMHKPADPKRAGMYLQAAIRRHGERRDGRAQADPLVPLLRSLKHPAKGLQARALGIIAVAIVAVMAPFFIGGHESAVPPATAPESVAAVVPRAEFAGPAEEATRRADPVLSRARAALQAGRLEAPEGRNALDLFHAVLLAQPSHAEATEGMARTTRLLLERAEREFGAGHRAEAERIVQRVLSVQPRHPASLELLGRISPPDTPSRQLAREEFAAVERATDEQPSARRAFITPPPATDSLREPVTHLFNLAPRPAAVAEASKPVTIQQDPLAPRYTNGTEADRAAFRLTRARSFEAPAVSPHATAGLAARGTAAGGNGVTDPAYPGSIAAADEFDRVFSRDPVYPPQALRNGTRGWVELEFTITETGAVADIQVVGAQPGGVFERSAADALTEWRFRPRVVNGKPVAQRSTITLHFDVDQG